MHRHHPYSSSFEGTLPRRGGPPHGPGPERSHFRGGGPRGRGRGRGGGPNPGPMYSGYDGPSGPAQYEQSLPPSDSGYYNGYDGGNQQDPYYQNGGSYANQPVAPSTPAYAESRSAPNGFSQPPYEDYEDSGYGNDEYGSRGKGFRREPNVHNSLVEERLQREKPCRTLFIRNIKYETDPEGVRRTFEEHGDVKTFFDLIGNRGMVFVTYFDLRAAERARDRLQGSDVGGRAIDVHYSLPREDSPNNDNLEMQGIMIVTLRNSMSGQPVDDNELRHRLQPLGDIKSIRPVDNRHDERYVEFYDLRSCDDLFERYRHQPLQDGVMDIRYAWNPEASSAGGPPGSRPGGRGRDLDDAPRGGPRGRGRGGRGRGGRGRGGGGGRDNGWERPSSLDREYDRGPPGRRFDDDHGRGRGGGGYGGDRFDGPPRDTGFVGYPSGPAGLPVPPRQGGPPSGYNTPPTQYSVPPSQSYGAPPISPKAPPSNSYGAPPPAAPAPPGDDRLEQARKVQQLLAALKQPGAPGIPATPAQAPPAASYNNGMSSGPPSSAAQSSYYNTQLAQPPIPSQMTPSSSYGSVPPPVGVYGTPPPAKPSTPSVTNLPPHVLQMLQQTAQAHGAPPPVASSQTYPPAGAPPPAPYGGMNATQSSYPPLGYPNQGR